MGMFNEVSQLEENMFHLLCVSFTAANEGRLGAAKQYAAALEEMDEDSKNITKKNFISNTTIETLVNLIR
jgi:hypothetical protein